MTLKEIADRCGVSIATVSRVINNKGNVKSDTKEKILQLLNQSDKSYKYLVSTERNQTIAVIVPDINNPFYGELIKGISKMADKHNFDILLYDTHDDPEKEFKYLKKASKQEINGIILMTSSKSYHCEGIKALFKQIKIPIILMDREIKNLQVDGVFFDDITGVFMLTELLIEQGHKSIGILTGEKDSEVTKKRLEGYKRALSEHEIPCNPKNIYYTSFTETHFAYDILENVLNSKNRPTAIISCSGLLTIALIKSINEAGLEIGKDISIVSFDDVKILQLLGIKITAAFTDLQEMGKAGFDLLYKKINKSSSLTNKLTIIPTIIKRGSEKSKL